MLDKQSLVEAWLLKAEHDLGTARIIYQHLPEYYDTICFHCQQAVEKYLKALLVHLNVEFRPLHQLTYLLDLLSEKIEVSDDWYQSAIVLENYSVEIRYPETIITLSDDDVSEAIQIAEKFQYIASERIISC
ncbi:MAG: HEPN domain-containing protein [Candidatus Neomarinimicrobiota bacterium]